MGLSPWFLERRENQEIYQLEFGETLLGRTETTQIVVTSVFASRKHCKITVSQTNPDEVYLEDLGTCNGTWINTNVKNGEKIRLREGDNIGIGCTIADHDDEKYYTFTVKRDNVPIENIIINIDEDEDEDEEDDEVEQVSVEEIEEDDPVEEVVERVEEDDPVEEVVERVLEDDPVKEVVEEDIFAAEEPEHEMENELSFSMKEEILDEIIEIEDIFPECNNNIEEDGDLFRHYEMKQELSMREQNSDIVLISDSEDEDIKEMNNWVLKLSQNFESKKSFRDIKEDSEEENNDADILNQLRSAFGDLPDEDKVTDKREDYSKADEIFELQIPKIEIDNEDDDIILHVTPTPSSSPKEIHEIRPSPVDSVIPIRECSVVLEKVTFVTETDSEKKLESSSDDEVKPPPKKFKRLSITNKVLFGPDDEDDEEEEEEGNASRIHTKANSPNAQPHPEVATDIKSSHKTKKRKASHDFEERRRSSSREKSDRSESSSSKIRKSCETRSKRHHSSSKEKSKSRFESKYKSKHVQSKKDVPDKTNKIITPEPDFIENPVSTKVAEEATKTKPDSKKPRQLEIIEPMNMPNRRRGSVKETSDKIDKTKQPDDMRRIQSRVIMAQKHENHLQNMKKKWKKGYSADKSKSSRSETDKVKEERKNRLQQIALANKIEKIGDEDPKVVNIPKVKVTEQNRGSFLTEALPCKIPGRRKSTSAMETRTHEKPVEEPKSSKVCSINDLGTVGKSISAFPKIPKVARVTLLETNIMSPPLPKCPNSVPIGSQISLTKTALKPRIARTISEEPIKSPTSSTCILNHQAILESDAIPKKSNLKRSPSQKNTKNSKPKRVRFSVDVSVRLYEVTYERKLLNVSEAQHKENSIAKLKKIDKLPTVVRKEIEVSLIFHPCENVINDITRWNTEWLRMPSNALPPINGSNVLLPIVHTYRNCTEYENIMIPLLKVELWRQIRNDYELRKNYKCRATVVNAKLLPKGNGKRYEFVCEVQNGLNDKIAEQVKEGMMLKVSAANKHFFAYMVFKDLMRTKDRQVTYITIQSTQSDITDAIHNEMRIEITCIAYIRIEVINMGFIFDIKESPLCDMILNPPIHIEVPDISDEYNPILDMTLNECQYNIVNYATNQCLDSSKPSIVLIDGPPGTGKSYLIANLVSTLTYLPENTKLKILICSATNNAIDIIMEKLIDIKKKKKNIKSHRDIRLIRYGVLEKMSTAVQAYSVQNLCKRNVDTWKREIESSATLTGVSLSTLLTEEKTIEKIINKLKQNGCSSGNIEEISKLEKKLGRIKNLANGNHIAYNEVRNKEKQLMANLICKADVICTTLTSCVQLMKTLKTMDVCIIDEATQCTEPWSIIPLKFKIKKLILVGDTKQLPAVVLSPEAKQNGLGNSLFTRIQQSFDVIAVSPVLPMTTQYRMHPEICEFPNKYFYDNQLKSSYKINADVPLRPYSVISLDCMQNDSSNNSSIYNSEEANFIKNLLNEILKLVDNKKVQICIITPYQNQRNEITKALACINVNDINVNTIDSFQGKEADIIILATTRTIGTGFLAHPQRLNVALTRARHSLIICGNFIKLKNLPFWSSLVEDAMVRQVFYKFDNFKNLMSNLI